MNKNLDNGQGDIQIEKSRTNKYEIIQKIKIVLQFSSIVVF